MQAFYQGVALGNVGCARFTFGREALTAASRLVYGYRGFCDFGELAFAVSGQSDAATKMAAIETAFSLPYGDLIIKNDDGSSSVNTILSSATVDGVKPVRLVWDDRPGAQFTTWRSYNAAFEWETRLAGLASSFLIDFTETVTVSGGTPKQVVQDPINVAVSAADEFVTVPKQHYTVTQTGRAVGLTAYPNLAVIAPLLYANPTVNVVSKITPKKLGAAYAEYGISWNYSWEFGALASLPVPNLYP